MHRKLQDFYFVLECVKEVSRYLKSRYVRTRFTSEGEEWPPDQPKHFTSLSLIHHKGGRTKKEVIAVTEATRSGDTDAIMSSSQMFFRQSKTSKDIKEIFAPDEDGEDHRSVLIEGAPGIGKTVLSKEISVQWAKSMILLNKVLLFLIFLRDPLVEHIKSLKDLVKYYYQFDESSDNIASSCAEYLFKSNGDCVTFIFDGYDEYAGNLQQNGFIFDILQRKRISNCGLVITSRPHVSAHLHRLFERRVDILGFTKEDRRNYIKSSLKGKPEDVDQLINYLDSHLTINSLCFIPFNMTMLLWLYKKGVVLPNSSTELYNYFICHTIHHHLAKYGVFVNDDILDLYNFEQPYKKIIQQLSFVSYEALNKNQLTFTLDEVKTVCPQINEIPGAINCFGLLQAIQYPGIMKMTTTLSFIHFSLQEFLAAYHITCLSYDDELSVLNQKFMSDVHANMFAVYVGITKGRRPAFKEYLKCGTSKGTLPAEKYSNITGPAFKGQRIEYGESLPDRSSITISTEILKNIHMCLHLFKCFHEAGDKDMCYKLIKAGCFSSGISEDHVLMQSSLSPYDTECLGLVLTSKQKWKLVGTYLSAAGVEILNHLLTTITPTINQIVFSNNESSNCIVKIVLMCKTTCLLVRSITPEFMCLQKQLVYLGIVVREQEPTTLATFLHENNVLRFLVLYIHRPEDLYEQLLQAVADSLKNNSTLKLSIAGLFSEEQLYTISNIIEVVKWKVIKTVTYKQWIDTVIIDFKLQC